MPSCDLNRTTPRNCTPEIAEDDNFQSEPVDSLELRERMKGLLEYMLQHFEAQYSEDGEG
jgi:hypothetical protein